MKLDTKELELIKRVVETARMVKIENVIIEKGKIRAIDEERSVVLFQDENVPDLEFGSIGLNRIDVFLSRLEIANSFDKMEVEVIQDDKNEYVRSLVMKGKGAKVEYRCANPVVIQAPKVITDTPRYKVKMTPEAVLMITKGASAMGADLVGVIGTKDGVSLEMEDINKDALTFAFSKKAEIVDDSTSVNFSHKYPTKILLALFKQNADADFIITTKGMIKTEVDGLTFYIPPRT